MTVEWPVSKMEDWGGVVYDHLVKFFKAPAERIVSRLDNGRLSIQVLKFDHVVEGCATFATVGFGKALPPPWQFMELVMVVDWGQEYIFDILCDASLYLMDQQVVPFVGMCMGVVAQSAPEFAKITSKSALYFTGPFPFPEEFGTIHNGGRQGRILLVTLISASEKEFLELHGAEALETLLSEAGVDIFSVNRKSVV